MRAIDVRDVSQVAEARRGAVVLARAHGFGEEDAGRVAIVATELATNLIRHGGGGALLIGSYDDASGSGIECLALDKGQGMADVAACMRDGYSTSGTPGTGLGAVSRASFLTEIYSAPGAGTAILARLNTSRSRSIDWHDGTAYGAVSVAMAGEEACGDSWCRKGGDQGGWYVMVADGLGHGIFAAEASNAAVRSFMQSNNKAVPSEMLADMHAALRPTRGAAIGIARLDFREGQILFAGVGNIAAVVIDEQLGIRRMVSHNGTIGHNARRMRDFKYDAGGAALMILASDGLGTSWRLDAYPHLLRQHPTLIAGVLYRDFARGRDDATVLVCRMGGQ